MYVNLWINRKVILLKVEIQFLSMAFISVSEDLIAIH